MISFLSNILSGFFYYLITTIFTKKLIIQLSLSNNHHLRILPGKTFMKLKENSLWIRVEIDKFWIARTCPSQVWIMGEKFNVHFSRSLFMVASWLKEPNVNRQHKRK
ncbi:hypothetical protein BABINDRAFT_69646 [Babjeviella inositovora NRRL Y-12698]|uniref:Uncharacterized protein n=1 Tax=Babjeviella inositovora NRRL Y-12698 TaxID=984486 RepID=A0A1E3QX41_9ASCO|nr:uncharacterized protein BABINDRAFT_69646 [Babjeviella inositovora NRRL Y-12698]ODQ82258.1 hypothetical protein BABINDRAFT_69646 [Babjeviella inositovora NRRL Y-12698]